MSAGTKFSSDEESTISAGRFFSFAALQVIYGHKVKSDPLCMATYDSFISAYLNDYD